MNGDCFLRAGFVGGAAPPGSEFTVFPVGQTGGGSKGMWSERTPPPRGPGRACSLALILGTVETRWKLSDKKAGNGNGKRRRRTKRQMFHEALITPPPKGAPVLRRASRIPRVRTESPASWGHGRGEGSGLGLWEKPTSNLAAKISASSKQTLPSEQGCSYLLLLW